MAQKKIAILTPTFSHYSGIDRVAERQALDYAKEGNKVTVFALEATIKPKGFNLEVLGMPKSLFLQRLYRLFFFIDCAKVNRTARKLKDYDVVISHQYPMNLIASKAKKKYGIRYVYHNHGIGYSELFSSPFERAYMKLFGYFSRLSLSNVDSAVSVSKFLKDELKKETGTESKVVYNKIGSRYGRGINGKPIRKKLGIKDNEKLLFFIGRLSPHKNIHTLLKIFDIVNEEMPNAKLLIAGKPTFKKYYDELKEIASKNVIFRESVSDKELPNYYAACDLYVTASLWEGFNLPIAEAQACGKKVVAFDIGSHPEVVKNGVLIKKNDIDGFAEAIIRLVK
ncbi:glycosyltransferase family 4 protein [Candidatus Woesearchaeota archaeon]|nr:glycosyltransferase family 4 protein [Candidatus Woesearchaeota archaeon]